MNIRLSGLSSHCPEKEGRFGNRRRKEEGLVDPEHPPLFLQELCTDKKLWLRTQEQKELQHQRTFLVPFFNVSPKITSRLKY